MYIARTVINQHLDTYMGNLLSGTLPFLGDLLRYALISGQYCEGVGRIRGGWVGWEVPKTI